MIINYNIFVLFPCLLVETGYSNNKKLTLTLFLENGAFPPCKELNTLTYKGWGASLLLRHCPSRLMETQINQFWGQQWPKRAWNCFTKKPRRLKVLGQHDEQTCVDFEVYPLGLLSPYSNRYTSPRPALFSITCFLKAGTTFTVGGCEGITSV